MKKFWRALSGVVVVVLTTASSCGGPEDNGDFAFRLDSDVREAAQERGLDTTDWIMERRLDNGEWMPSVGVSDGSALADTYVVDDCSTLGEMRVIDPESSHVLASLKDPICFTGADLDFVVTLDMIEWPDPSE